KDIDQPLLELGEEQLHGTTAQAQVVVLVRLEPGPTLLGLQLEEELDSLLGEAGESLGAGGGRRHAPGVYAARGTLRIMSTYVLVHGAWGGSYGWRKVRPLLQQASHSVFTPSLTGLGERAHLATPEVNLSTHIQDVCNTLWYEDLTDVILVGHSY